MKNHKSLLWILSFVTVLISFNFIPLKAQQAPVSIVVDNSGKEYKVTNLKAKYTPGGMWIGETPRK